MHVRLMKISCPQKEKLTRRCLNTALKWTVNEIPRWSESLECANMRSNNLNKYAITHFIMHIASVLSAISAIPPSPHRAVHGDTVEFISSPRFEHAACGIFGYTFLVVVLHASLSRSEVKELRQKNVIKINSNDKSNKSSDCTRCL